MSRPMSSTKTRSAGAVWAALALVLCAASCDPSRSDDRPAEAPPEPSNQVTPDPDPVNKAPDRAKFIKGLELVTTEAGFVEAVETFDAACGEVAKDDPDPAVTGFCDMHAKFREANTAAQKDPSKAMELRVTTKVWKESLDVLSVSLTKKPLQSPESDSTQESATEDSAPPASAKAPSNQPCGATFQCPDDEECLGEKGSKTCRPATAKECKSYWRCETDGYCNLVNGRCVLGVETDDDCKKSYGNRPGGGYNPCALGACRAVGGDCVE